MPLATHTSTLAQIVEALKEQIIPVEDKDPRK